MSNPTSQMYSQHRRVSTVGGDVVYEIDVNTNAPNLASQKSVKTYGGAGVTTPKTLRRVSKGSILECQPEEEIVVSGRKATMSEFEAQKHKEATTKMLEMNSSHSSQSSAKPNVPSAPQIAHLNSSFSRSMSLDPTNNFTTPRLNYSSTVGRRPSIPVDEPLDTERKALPVNEQQLQNSTIMRRLSKDKLVIGQVGGSNLSEISGGRRASSFYPQTEGGLMTRPSAGRRPSIYAQLDEMNATEPLYRTFTVSKNQ